MNLFKLLSASLLFLVFTYSESNPKFDIAGFKKSASEIVSKIVGKKVRLKHTSKNVGVKTMAKHDYFAGLNSSNQARITKYDFDAGTSNANHFIWVVIANYNNISLAAKAFKNLIKESGNVNSMDDHNPGLTYTNDYVMRSGNKIIWLNSGCLFSELDHPELAKYLRIAINYKVDESIVCKCGDVKCEVQAAINSR